MGIDGRERDDDGPTVRGEDNVVRLPRDWLGDRSELVPLAMSAQPRDADLPPNADDFWGEGSAAVQNALQAPRGPAASAETSIDQPVAAARRWARARPSRLRAPGRAITAVGLIAGLALIVSLTEAGSRVSPKRDAVRPRLTLPASMLTPPAKPLLAASTQARKTLAEPHARRRAMPVRAVTGHAIGRPEPAPARPGSQTQPAIVSPAAPASSSPAETQSVAGSAPASGTTGPTAQSAAQTSAPAGPTGSVALIGAGTSPSG